jgi:hypothetical protein
MTDLDRYPNISRQQFQWLMDQGVPLRVLTALLPIPVATGRRRSDGLFEETSDGRAFLVLPESDDLVYWQPRTGEIATATGRAAILGESDIFDPATYAFGGALQLHETPLHWLANACEGAVVIDWGRAYNFLRHAVRVVVPEGLVSEYREHMRPTDLPQVLVALDEKVAA